MLGNRVAKTHKKLAPAFERRNVGAFRLYDRDIPEIRAVVDWYEGHLVVGEYARQLTDAAPEWLPAMGAACAKALKLPDDRVHLRRRRTRPQEGQRYERLEQRGARIEVREGALKYLVNLDDFLDVGLFCDHRETRLLVSKECAGKSFLNLYAYTGSFTCAAAKAGATRTTTVDASGIYLDWAHDNLKLNGLDGPMHERKQVEAREFLKRIEGRVQFDVAFVDPPSFSSKGPDGGDFEVQRDHRKLIDETLAVLTPGGVLWFSTNHQRFEPELEGLNATERTKDTVPVDYRNEQVHRVFRVVK
ncbi:MAG: class I SAM-dependent methyltransferase [Deltaproteobacteria bacterium]|nr:class I SAM-dependent methyltransferase [Deltaproteobacteria bacterium]